MQEMTSKWEQDRVVAERRRFVGLSQEQAEEEIEGFLWQDAGSLDDCRRIILIAEDFECEVLVPTEWLADGTGRQMRT